MRDLPDDIDPSDTFDEEAVEVEHLMRTRGVDQAEALRILDRRADLARLDAENRAIAEAERLARKRRHRGQEGWEKCRHGYTLGRVDAEGYWTTTFTPCGLCPCPAGGRHTWAEQDSGDAYGPIGGGPGTRVVRWTACDECGAQPRNGEGR